MSSIPAVIHADRFDELFQDPVYLEFKEHLYSYIRRREEILRAVENTEGPIVEIGAGTCPVIRSGRRLIHSDVSEQAMRQLKARGRPALLSVFSASQIPLEAGTIGTVICSEVLEHMDDDQVALSEIARILQTDGTLVLTVPIHDYYFAHDDFFVGHRRRYSVQDLLSHLGKLGFSDFKVVKIAGPLEKLATLVTVRVYELVQRRRSGRRVGKLVRVVLPIYKVANSLCSVLIAWEARLLPVSVSTIVLIRCQKR